jgi:hypothetical protein
VIIKGRIKKAAPVTLPSTTKAALTMTPEGRHNGRESSYQGNCKKGKKKSRQQKGVRGDY